jgi:hypothetical protein
VVHGSAPTGSLLEGAVLLAKLRKYRIEVKYLLLFGLVVGALFSLESFGLLNGLNAGVTDFLTATEGLGAIGMFFVALVANCSIFVQVPYTLPMLSAALSGSDTGEMLVLGLAAGVGAGLGEMIKYLVAGRVLAQKPDLARSGLFRWVTRLVGERPRLVKGVVFVWAGSILPDDTVVIPLAMVRYGLRRIALPLFAGKVFHNMLFAMIFLWATDWAANQARNGVSVDFALVIMLVFVFMVLYQVEKARSIAKTQPLKVGVEIESDAA